MRHALRCPLLLTFFAASQLALAAEPPHNVILFVPDGLRAAIVKPELAPNFAKLRDEGVNFQNSHSLYPTFTTANASAFATGHGLGDTGDFANVIYVGFDATTAHGSVTPFLEDDAVLREINAQKRYEGNYLGRESLLTAAAKKGYMTAVVGKVGPAAIQALPALNESRILLLDDSTGASAGAPIGSEWIDALKTSSVPLQAPGRGSNGSAANGALVANYAQQQYFLEATLMDVLPAFKRAGKPFFLVFWSRDPDGTQHNEGDNVGDPEHGDGINGPTSLEAVRVADVALGAIRQQLQRLKLDGSTDIIVAADHGFSTITKTLGSRTLSLGFLALDLTKALHETDSGITLFEADASGAEVKWQDHVAPKYGNGRIGHTDAASADIIVAANGGSDLLYLTNPKTARTQARAIVAFLLKQDYVDGLFVDDDLGSIPGTVRMSDIGLKGDAKTPTPSIVVNFKSTPGNCEVPERCAREIADTSNQAGQGMHGSFGRADTWNFAAAIGPSFKAGYVDKMPMSNADVGMTVAHLLGLMPSSKGKVPGRVLEESFKDGREQPFAVRELASSPSADGTRTVVQQQQVGTHRYSDWAVLRRAQP